MPVVEDETGQQIYDPGKPVSPVAQPNPLDIERGVPRIPENPAGPVPSALTPMRGRQRFESEINQKGFPSHWGHLFNMYVLSLQEDPNDPEYNKILQWAKNNARRHEAGLSGKKLGSQKAKGKFVVPGEVGGGGETLEPAKPTMTGPKGSEKYGWQGPVIGGDANLQQEGKPDVPKGPKQPPPSFPDDEDLQAAGEKQHLRERRREWAKGDVFRGRPVDQAEIEQGALVTGNDTARTGDPYLDSFLSENGVALGGAGSKRAKRSGNYVYMGEETSDVLGMTRSSYLYADDAYAAGANPDVLPPEMLADYQKQLNEPVTGYLEGDLADIWDDAVKDAIRYTMAGNEITPMELFHMRVKVKVANYKSGGGRGGGGGGGAEKLGAFDYYRSMMQVLGDISGVGGE